MFYYTLQSCLLMKLRPFVVHLITKSFIETPSSSIYLIFKHEFEILVTQRWFYLIFSYNQVKDLENLIFYTYAKSMLYP